MKKSAILFVLLLANLIALAQSGPQWTGANFGYNYIFTAIDFPSNQNSIGFACGESLTYQGDGIVCKTTDGGTTWTQKWTGPGRGVEGASFPDVNTGYIAGWPKLGQGWSGFAKTTDGGTTWTSYPVTNDIYFFTDVAFKDADNGVLIGQTNTSAGIWVTSNGGATWTQGTGFVAVPQRVCHISGNTYFLADNGGHIQKSTNNGLTWSTVWDAGSGVYILGIDHFDDNIIIACGDYGLIVVSNDGGNTWTAVQVGSDIWHDVAWDSPYHVFVCGTPGRVYESWNGGITWQNANPQGAGQTGLYECIFTNDYHGFICGSQGVELKRVPSCLAGFEASTTSACTGHPVSYTDQSWGNITSYSWEFEGGTPASSGDPDPVVVYNTPGTYNVKLTVSNPWWSDVMEKLDYISVSQSPETPVISVNNFILTSDAATGNQWYLNGNAIPGANGQSWEATASGNYWDVVTSGSCSSDTSNNIYILMTGISDKDHNLFNVSPVPNNGKFTVTLPNANPDGCKIRVYNQFGVCVHTSEMKNSASTNIELKNIASGAYVVEVTTGTNLTERQLIIVI